MKNYKISVKCRIIINGCTLNVNPSYMTTYLDYTVDEIVTSDVESYIYSYIPKDMVVSYTIIENIFAGLAPGDYVKIIWDDRPEFNTMDIIKNITNTYITLCNNNLKFKLDGSTSKQYNIHIEIPSNIENAKYKEQLENESIISNIEYLIECGTLLDLTTEKLIEIQNILTSQE